MSIIHLRRGSVVVEEPTQALREGLRRFRHDESGTGQYEDLYTTSIGEEHDTLVTMPGFANRIMRLCRDEKFIDERVPLPEPDYKAAVDGLHECWHPTVVEAVKSGGGVVGIPEVLGSPTMAAAILRAFPSSALMERGTPLSLVVTGDREKARSMAFALRKILPDRDIGLSTPGSYTDSDDVIVTPYQALKDIPCWAAGVFIADDLVEGDFTVRAEAVSSVRNAARWGLYSTASGGCAVDDMAMEGLFGNVVAQATYSDAVKSGYAAPITVCWLVAPNPPRGVGYGPFRIQEAQAMQNNTEFCSMVSEIIRRTPGKMGCICCAELKAVAVKISAMLNGMSCECTVYNHTTNMKQQRVIRDDISAGNIVRAIVSYDVPLVPHHSVMVVATCKGGDMAMKRLPWKVASGPEDRAFIVDFKHQWDFHNGQPGYLARNDDARERRYKELGFRQMFLSSVDQLPFLDS